MKWRQNLLRNIRVFQMTRRQSHVTLVYKVTEYLVFQMTVNETLRVSLQDKGVLGVSRIV